MKKERSTLAEKQWRLAELRQEESRLRFRIANLSEAYQGHRARLEHAEAARCIKELAALGLQKQTIIARADNLNRLITRTVRERQKEQA